MTSVRRKANFKPQTKLSNTSLYSLCSTLTTFKLIVVHFCCNAKKMSTSNTFTSLIAFQVTWQDVGGRDGAGGAKLQSARRFHRAVRAVKLILSSFMLSETLTCCIHSGTGCSLSDPP